MQREPHPGRLALLEMRSLRLRLTQSRGSRPPQPAQRRCQRSSQLWPCLSVVSPSHPLLESGTRTWCPLLWRLMAGTRVSFRVARPGGQADHICMTLREGQLHRTGRDFSASVLETRFTVSAGLRPSPFFPEPMVMPELAGSCGPTVASLDLPWLSGLERVYPCSVVLIKARGAML